MKRAALIAFAFVVAGCVDREYVAGIYICPEYAMAVDTSCLDMRAFFGALCPLLFTLWIIGTLRAIRDGVDRIEKKLNAKPPAPPSDDARS